MNDQIDISDVSLSYRIAKKNDLHDIVALGIDSYSEYQRILDETDWADLNQNLNDFDKINEVFDRSTVFVCIHARHIVGAIFFLPSGNPTVHFLASWSYVRMLSVHPTYRGMGIGRILTSMCLDLARSTKEKTLALHTSEYMDAARHIYETMGFKQVKRFELFGKQYWIYTLNLIN